MTLIARLGTKFMVVSDPEMAEEVCNGDPMRRWTNMAWEDKPEILQDSKMISVGWRGSWEMSGWCLCHACIYIWKGFW